jgi:Aspartyl protease
MSRPVLLALVALSACTANPPVPGAPSVASAVGPAALAGDSGKVPVVRAHGLLFVEVSAESGTPMLALLDTGASASAIDPRRASDLKAVAKGDVVGTTGTVAADVVELTDLRLGALSLPSLRATRRDLSGLLSPDGRAVEMILGSDAFAGRALTIDFVERTAELGPSLLSAAPDEVGLSLDQGIPAIPARLGGIATMLRIDTGASLFETQDVYVNVPARIWSALRSLDPDLAPTTHFQGTGANGETVELPVARVGGSTPSTPSTPSTIGAQTLDAVFVIVQPEAGYFADPSAKGFVGVNFLEKLGRVTLDYGRARMSSTATRT